MGSFGEKVKASDSCKVLEQMNVMATTRVMHRGGARDLNGRKDIPRSQLRGGKVFSVFYMFMPPWKKLTLDTDDTS